MRNNSRCMIAIVGCIGAVSCSTPQMKPKNVSANEIIENRHDGVQPVVGLDGDLSEKTKGEVVAAKSFQVIAGILGGGVPISFGGGQRNSAPADGYTVTDGHATSFSAQQVRAFKGPASAEAEALDQKLKAMNVPVTTKSVYSLKVVSVVWGVDYDKLTKKDGYRIFYSINVDLMDGSRHVLSANCQGVTQDTYGLDTWNANDRALVKQDAAAIGDICADKTLVSMGLSPSAGAGGSAVNSAKSQRSGSSSS